MLGHDTGAFLFRVGNIEKPVDQHVIQTFPCIDQSRVIYACASYGPDFGGGNDLAIADNCNENIDSTSNIGKCYQTPQGVRHDSKQSKELLAGKCDFMVEDYEVF